MSNLLPLNFPHFIFRLRMKEVPPQIWDGIRQQWLVLTPEEWVRQHLIRYLIEVRGALPASVSQEYPIRLCGTRQRADVVITGRDGQVCLVAECKAPGVELSQQVWAQAIRYNSALKAPYVVMTNGEKHLCGHFDAALGRYVALDDFPDLHPFFRV